MRSTAYQQAAYSELTTVEKQILNWVHSQQTSNVEHLQKLVNCNSGSFNIAGIQAVGEQVSCFFSSLTQHIQQVPLPPWQRMGFDGVIHSQQLADAWLIQHRLDAPLQILLTGHLDTVFPMDSSFQQARFLNKKQLLGPGAADMKGGLLVMLTALQALEQHPNAAQIGWTVLLNTDEEIGSPGSASLLQEEAGKHHLGLIYEPALPDGNLAGERKGSGNFTFRIEGKSAHAGREPEKGRNAINLAAELILQLNKLNGQRTGLTLNTGIIQGGETTNQVPNLTIFKFNIRIQNPEDAQWCLQTLHEIESTYNQYDGYEVRLHGQFGRMPKRFDPEHLALYNLVAHCAQQLNFPLCWAATGGCCDGNNLSAAGLVNVDTLGVRGNFIHSSNEYMEVDSLTERSQLSALLLFQLAKEGLPQPKVGEL
jgi:glutamate carboxypeptidase